MTRKADPDVPQVLSAPIGGLIVGQHTLTSQSKLLESLCGRVGRRLSRWLTQNREVLPSAEWIESYRYYQATLLGLLKEQRERAKLLSQELEQLPTQTIEAQFRAELLRAAQTLTDDEWSRLDAARVQRTGPGRWVQEAG